jgi:glucose-1-phosphate adenylyltransferase
MGIYVFSTRLLLEVLHLDAANAASLHDFGHNILPSLIHSHNVRAYSFCDPETGRPWYWRDVGTIDAYFHAHMELLEEEPPFRLHDERWPILSYGRVQPPALIACPRPSPHFQRLIGPLAVRNALVGPGALVRDAVVDHVVLSPNVQIHSSAEVADAVLLHDVTVGPEVQIRRAIIDKGARIGAGMCIGANPDIDRARGFTVTASGIVVVPKGWTLEHRVRGRGTYEVNGVPTAPALGPARRVREL